MYFTGTADDHIDFVDKVIDHLVAEGWDELDVNTVDSSRWVRGPGGAGDPVIGFLTTTGSGIQAVTFQGSTGYNKDVAFDSQAGAIPVASGQPSMLLTDTSFTYILNVGADFFTAVGFVGSRTESCYCGFIQAYGPPGVYPYPLFIGGSANQILTGSDVSNDHCWFADSAKNSNSQKSSGLLRSSSGDWHRVKEWSNAAVVSTEPACFTHPNSFMKKSASGSLTSSHVVSVTDNGTAEEYVLHRMQLMVNTGGSLSLIGYFNALFWLTGIDAPDHSILAQDTITVGAVVYTVFNNTFRSGPNDFMAMLQDS